MNFNPVKGISGDSSTFFEVTDIPKHKAFLISNPTSSTATVSLKFMKPDGNGTDTFSIRIVANAGALYFPVRLHSVVSTNTSLNIVFLS